MKKILALMLCLLTAFCAVTGLSVNGAVVDSGSPEKLIEKADGKVWLVEADIKKAEEYVKKHKVSNVFSEADSYVLRIVSDEKPDAAAKPVFPTLEDVFLYTSSRR